MIVRTITIGRRQFLDLGGDMLPIDKIKQIKTDGVANGGCSNSVQVIVEGFDDREFIYAYENADAIRTFLNREYKR